MNSYITTSVLLSLTRFGSRMPSPEVKSLDPQPKRQNRARGATLLMEREPHAEVDGDPLALSDADEHD